MRTAEALQTARRELRALAIAAAAEQLRMQLERGRIDEPLRAFDMLAQSLAEPGMRALAEIEGRLREA